MEFQLFGEAKKGGKCQFTNGKQMAAPDTFVSTAYLCVFVYFRAFVCICVYLCIYLSFKNGKRMKAATFVCKVTQGLLLSRDC